ncbi:MAG: NINE protein [Clostridiales bacterium]|nr:NINE protein [Clostridiales bacterium]
MKKTKRFVCAAMAALMMAATMPGTYAYAGEAVHFEKDGDVDDTFVTQANELLALLPYEVQEQFGEDGWTFVITDKNLSQYFYNGAYSSVAGTTTVPDRWIYIEDRTKAVSRSVIHETGHALDYELGYPSQSDEFKTIFAAEKSSFRDSTSVGDSHEASNCYEYFASAWSEYILNPTGLIARTPQTYVTCPHCGQQFPADDKSGIIRCPYCAKRIIQAEPAADMNQLINIPDSPSIPVPPEEVPQPADEPHQYTISLKSWRMRSILCFSLGVFGAHRFYTGKYISGVIWAVTFGVFGVGWLTGVVMVLTGHFKDKSGAVIRRQNVEQWFPF